MTIADELRREGKKEGEQEGRKKGKKEGELLALRRMLLQQLHERFGEVPAAIVAAIQKTKNIEHLETWGKQFATAATLDDVGITSANG